MSAKAKSAEVIFLRKVGLSPSYDHTWRFDDELEQENFFLRKAYCRYINMVYIRTSYNTIEMRVQIKSPQANVNTGEMEEKRPEILYDCDYLMYNEHRKDKSQSHGLKGRWFYCFITGIEYINEGNYRVYCQIDFIQTYMVAYWNGMKKCFIVRQHSKKDGIYENVVPENIEIGDEYQFEWLEWNNINVVPGVAEDEQQTYTGWCPVVCLPKSGENNKTNIYSNIPSMLQFTAFEARKTHTVEDDRFTGLGFDNFLKEMDGKTEASIITMFMYPKRLVPGTRQHGMQALTETVTLAGKGYNPWESIGYTPKNNKLYTYPYCFIQVVNGCGQSQEYKQEWVTERGVDTLYFDIYGTFGANPEFICRPRNYCSADRLPFNCVTLSGVPSIGWSADNYKIYLAQNEASLKTNAVLNKFSAIESVMNFTQGLGSSIGGAVTGALSEPAQGQSVMSNMYNGAGQGIPQMAGAVNTMKNVVVYAAKQQDMKNIAKTSHLAQTPNPQYALGKMGFMGYYARLAGTWVQRVDNYFTMFGYAVNNLGTPNMYNRKGWTHIKAEAVCNVSDVPPIAKTMYSYVLSKGITFWNSNYTLGDYSQDNSV